ncbi:MAG: hypothetical protein IJX04_07230 [Oscillospiraceae bacterium]|nr:hypothetical protein [Oscillospiraceae bacterium]
MGKVEGGGIVLRNVDGEMMKNERKLEKPPEEVGEKPFPGVLGFGTAENSSRKEQQQKAIERSGGLITV